MNTRTITVLNPAGKPKAKDFAVVPMLSNLDGKVVGFLWNGKSNGDLLLSRIEELLSQKFKLAGTFWQSKRYAGVPAEAAILEELVNKTDLVITATAD